jgi:ribosomal protein S18 acetylase RimI-like enzyme
VDYSILDRCDSALLERAVDLHFEALSYRSFITSFGKRFLRELYVSLLDARLAFLVTATEGARLEGFILACEDSTRLMKAVTRRPLRFGPLILLKLLRHPSLIAKTFETLFYSRKEATDVKAELVVIAVNEGTRSKGLGTQLVRTLEEALRARSIERYKVTVHAAMERSNAFYVRNGMKLASSFELYGVVWNLYVQEVRRAP